MKTTHNLESYVQWFNHLSYVVASEICSVSALIKVISLLISTVKIMSLLLIESGKYPFLEVCVLFSAGVINKNKI